MAEQVPKELWDVAAVLPPGGGFCSGRLIAPGLVLTTGHEGDHSSTTGWRVHLLGQRSANGTWGEPYEGERIWRGQAVDLALLKIGEKAPRPAFATVFSSLVGEIGLEATGYPKATRDAEDTAWNYRLPGRLRVERIGHPYAFNVEKADVPKEVITEWIDDHPVQKPLNWKGMSGAVVVGQDPPGRMRVFGAVEHVKEMFPHGKLYVARIAAAFDEPAFRDALKQALGEEPTLIPVSAGSGPALPLDFDAVEPSTELSSTLTLQRFSPRNPRVRFVGRKDELAALKKFLLAERSQPFAWWLITGGGGAGKTRLALELCHYAYRRGWQVGFLADGFKADVAPLNTWCPQVPTLIVADYVMKRVGEIRTLAARLARRDDLPPVHLLLLEREGGGAIRKPVHGQRYK